MTKITTPVYESIGEFIRARRLELKVSQRELGALIGVTPAAISHYEAGKRKPNLHILNLIAAGTSLPMEVLLQFDSPRPDLRAALRSHQLDPSEIESVLRYIRYLKKSKSLPG